MEVSSTSMKVARVDGKRDRPMGLWRVSRWLEIGGAMVAVPYQSPDISIRRLI